MRTFHELFTGRAWRELRGCPGRYVLAAPEPGLTPEALAGSDAPAQEHHVPAARDAVLVLPLPGGGGLITYRHPDGTHLHTLNSPEGLARKLAQLGIPEG
ncbi:MAG TPA: hypothetical protein PK668_24990 [Myxococcota bacterium]|nr:hypothetical protein [Myxococcota bacterium]HRY96802.1 hypothetical protein [Myxococcota bacterium]HSA23997.1 hypothetical protein [Myxococcota bacterium]